MKFLEKLKEYINNNGHKKIIYNFIIIIIICTIALVVWDTFMPKTITGLKESPDKNSNAKEHIERKNVYNDDLETQLENILSQIKGVGAVKVMITYDSSTEVVPASNITKSNQITEERDSQGGIRKTTQEDMSQNVVTTNDTNNLVVIKEIKPQIRGVVVVAEGAGNIQVKTELVEAVRTIFQIPIYKVMVYEKQ